MFCRGNRDSFGVEVSIVAKGEETIDDARMAAEAKAGASGRESASCRRYVEFLEGQGFLVCDAHPWIRNWKSAPTFAISMLSKSGRMDLSS